MVLISQPFAAALSQSANPALHVEVHAPAVHAAVPFAGIAHAVHIAPQAVASLSATHFPAQR